MIKKVAHPGLREEKYLKGIIGDCKRIQLAYLSMGYWADLGDCYEVWSRLSENMDGSWIILPSTLDDIWKQIEMFGYSPLDFSGKL